jgi:spore coat polysaccharide biosynthesis predicted glycosyltransferase SpsG
MGHVFRASNIVDMLATHGIDSMVFVNWHAPAADLLRKRGISFKVLDHNFEDHEWERKLIEEYGISTWINDRLDTDAAHARRVTSDGVRLVTFDDRGDGSDFSQVHIAGMAFDPSEMLGGRQVYRGLDYLVLNPEIPQYVRHRTKLNRILVTLGGTDTYGITVQIVKMLGRIGRQATVVLGPGFQHKESVLKILAPGIELMENVDSLMREFFRHDLAITGGGVTPFEASASGLPCLTISSEPFEMAPCRFLSKTGASFYLGHRTELEAVNLERVLMELDIAKRSSQGIETVPTSGARNICHILESHE